MSSGLSERRDDLLGRVLHVVSWDDREAGALEDRFALLDVRALEAHDDGNLDADLLDGVHDAGRDDVAAHDAAEDVDEDGLHVRVGQDDPHRVLDLLLVRAAADVQEVRRATARELNDVHRGHREAGAVHHAAYVPVELDVVEAELRRLDLERVFLVEVAVLLDVGMPKERVVVEVHLGVERDDVTAARDQERVDLGERGVRRDIGLRERDEETDGLLVGLPREAERVGQLAGLKGLESPGRVERFLHDGVRILRGDDFDLHSALLARHHHGPADRAVERNADVELPRDVERLLDEDFFDPLAARSRLVRDELHADDLLGELDGLVRSLRELDASALAASAGVDLRLDDDASAELFRDPARLLGRVRDVAARRGDAERAEDSLGLVFVYFHGDREGYQKENSALHDETASYPRLRARRPRPTRRTGAHADAGRRPMSEVIRDQAPRSSRTSRPS